MENIHVALRVRPLNEKEKENEENGIWNFINNDHITLKQEYVQELAS